MGIHYAFLLLTLYGYLWPRALTPRENVIGTPGQEVVREALSLFFNPHRGAKFACEKEG
jgi:hypothetical protein